MIIKYYNPEYEMGRFSCKKVCTKCKSAIWTKNFYDVGNFEITGPEEIPEIGDFIIQGSHCGIVCRILDNDQHVKVYGYDLKGLLCFRYLHNYNTTEKNVDKIIKDIAELSLCRGKRKIEGVVVKDYDNTIIEEINGSYSMEKIYASELLKNIAGVYEIGWDIQFDEEQLLFVTKKGADLTDKIIFSKKFRNIEKIEYEKSVFNSANVVCDAEGTHFDGEEPEGINRRESGITDKGIKETLKEKNIVETLKGYANDRMAYGIDYQIGDYVTVMHNNQYTIKQITKVEFVYEPCGSKIVPTFGELKENIIKKIARKV